MALGRPRRHETAAVVPDQEARRIQARRQSELYRRWEDEARRNGQDEAARRINFRRRYIVESEVR